MGYLKIYKETKSRQYKIEYWRCEIDLGIITVGALYKYPLRTHLRSYLSDKSLSYAKVRKLFSQLHNRIHKIEKLRLIIIINSFLLSFFGFNPSPLFPSLKHFWRRWYKVGSSTRARCFSTDFDPARPHTSFNHSTTHSWVSPYVILCHSWWSMDRNLLILGI